MSVAVGSVCHIELFAWDMGESAVFYTNVFNWSTTPHDSGYLLWEDPYGNRGGFTTGGSPITNPAATFYIKVDDIPTTLKKIVDNGGVIIKEKTPITDTMGFYAQFRDPSGNNIGIQSTD